MSYLSETVQGQKVHPTLLPNSRLEDLRTPVTNTSYMTSPLIAQTSAETAASSGLSNYVQQILHSQKTQSVSIYELLKKVQHQKTMSKN